MRYRAGVAGSTDGHLAGCGARTHAPGARARARARASGNGAPVGDAAAGGAPEIRSAGAADLRRPRADDVDDLDGRGVLERGGTPGSHARTRHRYIEGTIAAGMVRLLRAGSGTPATALPEPVDLLAGDHAAGDARSATHAGFWLAGDALIRIAVDDDGA